MQCTTIWVHGFLKKRIKMNKEKGISVLMPTYNQATFIRRAIISLMNQTYKQWELIIINDGSTDKTKYYIEDFLSDPRINYIEIDRNRGLGYVLNLGLDNAKYDYIAYLPSDDFYLKDHLQFMEDKIEKYKNCILVFSGFSFELPDTMGGIFHMNNTLYLRQGYCLQLVQTMHKKTEDRWLERKEWVTEDLFAMYWGKLSMRGAFVPTRSISCFWTNHPFQRHKIICENYGGGINYYRQYYSVNTPIKMRVSADKYIDEEKLYEKFRNKQINIGTVKTLKILIVGELAYNPERIYALEEAGHKLYGLWVQRPQYSFQTVGPIPFGKIEDVSYDNWEHEVQKIKPDIIYGLLNSVAVPLAYEVQRKFGNIPFVWHFKEGPSVCLRTGLWEKLIYLYTYSDGKIFINEIAKQWYEQFIPKTGLSFILDGDLPKKDCFQKNMSNKLSEIDGNIHTLVTGRMIGIDFNIWKVFVEKDIHIHVYTENYIVMKEKMFSEIKKIAPSHFHLHPHCSHDRWVEEFSKYDAGWLHCLNSSNRRDLAQVSWDDLNIPARISTYAAAGIPMILKNNKEHIVATQQKLEELGIGIFYNQYEDLASKLTDKLEMEKLQNNVLLNREQFYFDKHVPQLISFFERVIESKK